MKILAFDLMGTLLDVDSIQISDYVVSYRRKAFMELWRRKQIEYAWRTAIMGLKLTFWEITNKALLYAVTLYRIEASQSQINEMMERWLNRALLTV